MICFMIEEVEGLAHLEWVILSSTLPQTSGRRKRRGWKMRNETVQLESAFDACLVGVVSSRVSVVARCSALA